MILRLLNKIPHRVIVNCARDAYLTRWYLLRRESFAIFLHRFHRSDEDRALHDHPWSFITFILWRGYLEHTAKPCPRCTVGGDHAFSGECSQCGGFKTIPVIKRKWPLMICWRPAEWRHRVELVNGQPAWTIIIRFAWNKWWQNNCE